MYCSVFSDRGSLCIVALDQSYLPDKSIMPVLFKLDDSFSGNICEWYERHVHDENKIQMITFDFLMVYKDIQDNLSVPYHLLFNPFALDLYTVCHLINRRSKIMSEYNRIRVPKKVGQLFNYFEVNKRGWDKPTDLAKVTLKISQCYVKAITRNMV